ncbi:MAG: hypothetical protein H6672_13935 [Anaerolineaceae bacterium]|nr:hypothetical protein [Anaerolineaceae bacterium]
MSEIPPHIQMSAYIHAFVAVHVFEANYKTKDDEQSIPIETRTKSDGSMIVMTAINNQPIYTNSISSLIWILPNCVSLSIAHPLSLLGNGIIHKGILTEVFLPPEEDSPYRYSIQIRLSTEGKTYETTPCDTLSDAILELGGVIENSQAKNGWQLQTCYHCKYCYPAFYWPGSDRDTLRCYRDVGEAFAEIQEKGKRASFSAFAAGDYFVNAFHRCAAWQPYRSFHE